MFASIAFPSLIALTIASLFVFGNAPGKPKQTGQVLEFGF